MDLEAELHCKLFEREHHRLALTQEGLLLLRRAEQILSLVGKTESEFRSLGKHLSGDIRIGAGETDAMDDVAAVMQEMRGTHPAVHFHLYDDSSMHVLELLDRGLLDFGVVIHPVDTARYEGLPLPTESEWGIIMRKDDPLAGKGALTLEDIRRLPIVCSRPQNDPRSRNLRSYPGWLAEALPHLNIVGTNNLLYNTLFMVERGVVYPLAIKMRCIVEGDTELCFRPFEPAVRSSHSIVWRRDEVFPPASAHFLCRLKERFGI